MYESFVFVMCSFACPAGRIFIGTCFKNEVCMRVRVLSSVELRVQLGVFTVYFSFIGTLVSIVVHFLLWEAMNRQNNANW